MGDLHSVMFQLAQRYQAEEDSPNKFLRPHTEINKNTPRTAPNQLRGTRAPEQDLPEFIVAALAFQLN